MIVILDKGLPFWKVLFRELPLPQGAPSVVVFCHPSFQGKSYFKVYILAKGVSDSRTPMLRNRAPGIDKKAFAERAATE